MIALPVVDLPQPDSPTSPSVSPGFTSRLTFGDGVDLQPGAADGELDDEILDAQQRLLGRAEMCGTGTGHQADHRGRATASTRLARPAVPWRSRPAATLRRERGLPGLGADRDRSSGTSGRASRRRRDRGSSSTQRGCAYGQRAANLQPVGGFTRSGGRPLDRLEPRVARLRELRDRLEQRLGVRVARRASNSSRVGARLDDPARRTSPRSSRRGPRRRRGRG